MWGGTSFEGERVGCVCVCVSAPVRVHGSMGEPRRWPLSGVFGSAYLHGHRASFVLGGAVAGMSAGPLWKQAFQRDPLLLSVRRALCLKAERSHVCARMRAMQRCVSPWDSVNTHTGTPVGSCMHVWTCARRCVSVRMCTHLCVCMRVCTCGGVRMHARDGVAV